MKARTLTPWLVAALSVQRLLELRHARRNEVWARSQGAREYGAGHYPAIAALHTGWMVGLLQEGRQARGKVSVPFLLAGLALQVLRYRVINELGPYWNTKILVVPGARRVNTGVYRKLKHPNYLIVMAELFLLPLIVNARRTSLIGGVLNVLLLTQVRIPAEERALQEYE